MFREKNFAVSFVVIFGCELLKIDKCDYTVLQGTDGNTITANEN
jgi:hypothetical protein